LEDKDYISFLLIDFERGTKSISSPSRPWPELDDTSKLVAPFDTSLTLIMTLYKDSTGNYLEKKGKLVLRGHSKVTQTVVKLGLVNLSLNTLAADYAKQNMVLQTNDFKGKKMGSIDISTTAKYLGEGDAGDDDSSVVSGASKSSFQSPSLEPHPQGIHLHSRQKFQNINQESNDKEVLKSSSAMKEKHPGYNDIYTPTYNNDKTNHKDSSSLIRLTNNQSEHYTPTYDNDKRNHQDSSSLIRSENNDITNKNVTTQNHDDFHKKKFENVEKKSFTNEKNSTPFSPPPTNCNQLDDKDREILLLRSKLEETVIYQNSLEGEFQTKISSMIERIIEIEDEGDLEHYNHGQ
jgi:hypothetical protein